jgi:hypothetical protein
VGLDWRPWSEGEENPLDVHVRYQPPPLIGRAAHEKGGVTMQGSHSRSQASTGPKDAKRVRAGFRDIIASLMGVVRAALTS